MLAPKLNSTLAHVIAAVTAVLGIGSLLCFGAFLWLGGQEVVDLGLATGPTLLWDSGLCALFFLQHSCMIRRSFRRWLATIAPEHWHGVLYTNASAIVLVFLVVFWQASPEHIYTAGATIHLLMRTLLLLSLAGVVWGISSLRDFDAFGTKAFLLQSRGAQRPTDELSVAGPYRFVRHPFYAFAIVAVWATPTLSLDRLVFAALFTMWIIGGAVLEERDLSLAFGPKYRDYQNTVPMFLPRLHRSHRSPTAKGSAAGGGF